MSLTPRGRERAVVRFGTLDTIDRATAVVNRERRGQAWRAKGAVMRSVLKRLIMGLVVAALFLGVLEAALHLVLPAPPPRLVRQLWNASAPAFTEQGGQVLATFQDQDIIPPFSAEPAPGRVRVMVFGESSVRAGSQIALTEEFPALLEQALLNAARDVEVLNLGRPGMDSHGMRILVEQAVAYKPDVAVIYTGHNDIGNAYMTKRYGDVQGATMAKLRLAVDQLRLYGLLRKVVERTAPAQFVPNSMTQHSTEALPPEQRELAEVEFRRNLEWIVRRLKQAGARVVLSTVGSDLMQWNAGLAACSEALPEGTWVNDGMRLVLRPEVPSDAQLEAAMKVAPDCPELYFMRGRRRDAAGDGRGALEDLVRARDLDRVPLRATAGIIEGIKAVAASEQVPLVDYEARIHSDLGHHYLFADVVHLSAAGHQLVAQTVLPVLKGEVDAVAAEKKR